MYLTQFIDWNCNTRAHLVVRVLDELAAGHRALLVAGGELQDGAGIVGVERHHRLVLQLHLALGVARAGIDVAYKALVPETKKLKYS